MIKKKNLLLLEQSANISRGICFDSIKKANSGHLGLPLGAAEIGASLFGHVLNFNPKKPLWINRDRFVLSAGHGSIFLYSWLHLSGFNILLKDLKQFRQMGSKTPGHPEYNPKIGIESTTGPLGQGIGNAVGMAIASKILSKKTNKSGFKIINNFVYCLAGDGCMQEGVSSESFSIAGHYNLDNLIIIYDSNDVTLDSRVEDTQSDNVTKRFESYGFKVKTVNGHSILDLIKALLWAKKNKTKKPKLIIAKTIIGKGIKEIEGTCQAHGEFGIKFSNSLKKKINLENKEFYISKNVYSFFKKRKNKLIENYQIWKKQYTKWKLKYHYLAEDLKKQQNLKNFKKEKKLITFLKNLNPISYKKKIATRSAGYKIIQKIGKKDSWFLSGSADLHSSTKNYMEKLGTFSKENYTGRNFLWGVREHAMAAIMNGIAYYNFFRVSGATFLSFSDYMRPSIRISCLSKLPIIFLWTHDSILVGEDGPTHEPIETISSLRLIPNLDVIRPADSEETVGAFIAALERKDGPTAIIMTRQDVKDIYKIPSKNRREGVLKGGYIAYKEKCNLKLLIFATGSELELAISVAKNIGNARVISMPCLERFDRQTNIYKSFVIPDNKKVKRVSIELGSTHIWNKYVGRNGITFGIDEFGFSAPSNTIVKKIKMTPKKIISEINKKFFIKK
jgi:transketolase